ncbi:hypothetical protein [uncultured Gimesia sp.]|uniref:hypothetical protein n=1 Tax=uncultured Gimesia sp. TaxID=1678688 RepID=UPI0026352B3F|nr:hypothetical protein [uncultured Gimesia sp.]
MNEAKYSQFKDQANQRKPSRLRWFFPFLLISFHFLIVALLLLMRATGLIQISQSLFPLLTVGGVMSCISFAVLLLIRALRLMNLTVGQQNGLTLVTVLPVIAGMLALLPAEELTVAGALSFGLVYFLGFAGVLELINREVSKNRAIEIHIFEKDKGTDLVSLFNHHPVSEQNPIAAEEDIDSESSDMIDENNEALFEALLDQKDSNQQTLDINEREENRSQWMNRTMESEGVEVVEGGTLVQFSRNQKVSIVHIGLSPPMDGNIYVSCSFETGMPVRFRVLETRGYGISVEVKRTGELDSEFNTYLHYQISNQQINEEAA